MDAHVSFSAGSIWHTPEYCAFVKQHGGRGSAAFTTKSEPPPARPQRHRAQENPASAWPTSGSILARLSRRRARPRRSEEGARPVPTVYAEIISAPCRSGPLPFVWWMTHQEASP